MAVVRIETEGTSLVLLGAFNPAIFHPAWFAWQKLIRPAEAESATVDVVHSSLTRVAFGPFRVEALPQRVTFAAEDPSQCELLRDLLIGTFRLLPHTPVRAYGINVHAHVVSSEGGLWKSVQARFVSSAALTMFGGSASLNDLEVRYSSAGPAGRRTDVRLQPSNLFDEGVFMLVNQHYDFPAASEHTEPSALPFVRSIESDFERTVTWIRGNMRSTLGVTDE
jgi:hypothetical protein